MNYQERKKQQRAFRQEWIKILENTPRIPSLLIDHTHIDVGGNSCNIAVCNNANYEYVPFFYIPEVREKFGLPKEIVPFEMAKTDIIQFQAFIEPKKRDV